MSICTNRLFREIVETAARSVDTQALKHGSVLITGSTGLIGSAIVDLLLWKNRNEDADIRIYAASRSLERVSARFEGYSERDGLIGTAYDAREPGHFAFHSDFIIHAASNSTPDAYVRYPVDTIISNVLGIHELLMYALAQGTRKTVYVSSSEVYGMKPHALPIREDEYGTTDILNVRASYPVGKQAAETLCASYAHQYGCDVSIVRPGHIYGPTATASDQRVSSLFARLAAEGRDIVMKSPGQQLRSYCHCLDCATAILTVLMKGHAGEAYNISNSRSIITIRQMAEIVARCGQVSIRSEYPSEQERAAFNPMNNSSLNSEKLEALGWKGIYDADEGLRTTVEILRSERC